MNKNYKWMGATLLFLLNACQFSDYSTNALSASDTTTEPPSGENIDDVDTSFTDTAIWISDMIPIPKSENRTCHVITYELPPVEPVSVDSVDIDL